MERALSFAYGGLDAEKFLGGICWDTVKATADVLAGLADG